MLASPNNVDDPTDLKDRHSSHHLNCSVSAPCSPLVSRTARFGFVQPVDPGDLSLMESTFRGLHIGAGSGAGVHSSQQQHSQQHPQSMHAPLDEDNELLNVLPRSLNELNAPEDTSFEGAHEAAEHLDKHLAIADVWDAGYISSTPIKSIKRSTSLNQNIYRYWEPLATEVQQAAQVQVIASQANAQQSPSLTPSATPSTPSLNGSSLNGSLLNGSSSRVYSRSYKDYDDPLGKYYDTESPVVSSAVESPALAGSVDAEQVQTQQQSELDSQGETPASSNLYEYSPAALHHHQTPYQYAPYQMQTPYMDPNTWAYTQQPYTAMPPTTMTAMTAMTTMPPSGPYSQPQDSLMPQNPLINASQMYYNVYPGYQPYFQSMQPWMSQTQMGLDGNDLLPTEKPALCPFALNGNCRYGDNCRMLHGLPCPKCAKYVLHPHDTEEEHQKHIEECEKQQMEAQERNIKLADNVDELVCGLCFEKVVNKRDPRFGLLFCSHVFCLSCIRQWRNNIIHLSEATDATISCPACTKEDEISYFVTPSAMWPTQVADKHSLLMDYRVKMSHVPCKFYYNGRCPYGSGCIFKHDATQPYHANPSYRSGYSPSLTTRRIGEDASESDGDASYNAYGTSYREPSLSNYSKSPSSNHHHAYSYNSSSSSSGIKLVGNADGVKVLGEITLSDFITEKIKSKKKS